MKPVVRSAKGILAASLAAALTGCSGLPGLLAGSGLGLSGRAALDSGTALAADGLAAVEVDDELDRGAAAAEDASYKTLSTCESGRGEGSGGLGHQMERLRRLARSQLDAFKKHVVVATPSVTTSADGSVTTITEITIARNHHTSKEVITRTTAADGTLLAVTYDLERTNKSGHSMVVHRERHLNADGSWTGTFRKVVTRKDGKTKTVVWTASGAADGSEQASGTITRFDGSTATISIVRATDGTVTIVLHDDRAKITAEAARIESSSSAEVKIKTDGDDKIVETAEISDTAEVEISDQ